MKIDIAKAENCKDKAITVNNVTVIKNEVLGLKNTDKIIAKNGNGKANTDQVAGKNVANPAIIKDNVATISISLFFKNFGSKYLK